MRSKILSISLCVFTRKLPLLGSIAWDQHQTFGFNEPISGFMEKLDYYIDSFRSEHPSGPLGLMPLPASMSCSRRHPVGSTIPHHSRILPTRKVVSRLFNRPFYRVYSAVSNFPSEDGPRGSMDPGVFSYRWSCRPLPSGASDERGL